MNDMNGMWEMWVYDEAAQSAHRQPLSALTLESMNRGKG